MCVGGLGGGILRSATAGTDNGGGISKKGPITAPAPSKKVPLTAPLAFLKLNGTWHRHLPSLQQVPLQSPVKPATVPVSRHLSAQVLVSVDRYRSLIIKEVQHLPDFESGTNFFISGYFIRNIPNPSPVAMLISGISCILLTSSLKFFEYTAFPAR